MNNGLRSVCKVRKGKVLNETVLMQCINFYKLKFFSWLDSRSGLRRPQCWGFDMTRHYVQYGSSGRVISPLKWPLPDNTQHSQETDNHASGGSRTPQSQQANSRKPTSQGARPLDSAKTGIRIKKKTSRNYSENYCFSSQKKGARGSAVGWGTALQVGRSRVRFPMVSLEFFIDIILPAALWPWGWLSL